MDKEDWEYYREEGIKVTPKLKKVVHQFRTRVNKEIDNNWRNSNVNEEVQYELQELTNNLIWGYPEMGEDFELFKKDNYAVLRSFKVFEKLTKKDRNILRFLHIERPEDVDPY